MVESRDTWLMFIDAEAPGESKRCVILMLELLCCWKIHGSRASRGHYIGTAGREVHAGGKGALHVRFRILRVCPVDPEIFRYRIGTGYIEVLQPLVANDSIEVIAVHAAGEFVPFPVVGACRKPPGPFGIYLARKRQIHIVVDGKIISSIVEVEAPLHLVAVRRHDNARGVGLGEGEEGEGEDNREKRDIGNHQPGRSGNHILFGSHLGLGEVQVEVGMVVQVAGGIFGIYHVEGVVGILLRRVGDDMPLSLLGDDVGYKCLAGVEIVAHLFHLIFGTSLCKHRMTELLPNNRSKVEDDAAVEIHRNLFTLDGQIAIFHVGFTVGKPMFP